MSFTAGEVRHITSGNANAWLAEATIWRPMNGQWRGEVPVWADGFMLGEVAFWLMTARTNRPSFVLVIRGMACRRLDVNTPHRSLPDTHIQGRDDPAADEFEVDARDLFPPIPKSGTVDGQQYCATFLAFAEHLGIGSGTFEWVDVPEGRPS